jgi:hypothetical protein
LTRRSWEDYKGTRFYNGQQALVVERWLNRVEEDALGLTFEEWNPTQDADASQPPVAMLINSSKLRAPPSGLGAKCLFAPLLDNQDRALRLSFTHVHGKI